MNSSSNRHVFLLLFEIMIAILFFALTSAVCLRIFARSHTLSTETAELNLASSNISNVAELLKSVDRTSLDDPDSITDILSLDYDTLSAADQEWVLSCDTGYRIVITQSSAKEDPSICMFLITVLRTSDDTEIDHLLLELYAEE